MVVVDAEVLVLVDVTMVVLVLALVEVVLPLPPEAAQVKTAGPFESMSAHVNGALGCNGFTWYGVGTRARHRVNIDKQARVSSLCRIRITHEVLVPIMNVNLLHRYLVCCRSLATRWLCRH